MRELRLEEAVHEVGEALPESSNVKAMLDAVSSSQRGLARPETATFEINMADD